MNSYSHNFKAYREIIDRILRLDFSTFDLPREGKILDVGCGWGHDLRKLSEQGYDVIGIEPDPSIIEKNKDPRVIQARIQETRQEPNSLSAVLVNNVFHHIPGEDYEVALKEIHRVLKEDGTLCFIEPRNSFLRFGMDVLTFQTPLPKFSSHVKARYDVMIEEVESGLYPLFLKEQKNFLKLMRQYFEVDWFRNTHFFFFCQAKPKSFK